MPYNFYPVTEYQNKLATDIIKRFQFSDGYRKSIYVENYTVNDGETPESLAYLLYRDSRLSWLVLMINSIMDRNNEWPYSNQELLSIINNRYSGSSLFFSDVEINFSLSKASYFNWNSGTQNHTFYIKSVDRNFNKITSFENLGLLTNGDIINVYDKNDNLIGSPIISRIVYEDKFSVHHFEKDGMYKDPRDLEDGSSTMIKRYITGLQAEEFAVTNYDYELKTNDSKRQILLVVPEQLENVLVSVQRLFDGVDKNRNILDIQAEVGDISE